MSESPTGFVRLSAAGVSRPGTFARIVEPGLKPSSTLYGAGSIALPLTLRGMSPLPNASLMPVFVFLSALVCALSGNGSSFGAAACAAAGASRTSARGRSFVTGANLHGVRSLVHASLRPPLRLRAEHRRAARPVPPGAPRALSELARGRPAAHGRRGGRPSDGRPDRLHGR